VATIKWVMPKSAKCGQTCLGKTKHQNPLFGGGHFKQMNKPNKKYSISLTAAEWDIILRAVLMGEMDLVDFIEEVDGIEGDAKHDLISEIIGKFSRQIKN